MDGLLRDKTRKPGKPPIAAETVARVVAADLRRPAASGDALDRPRDGQSGRHLAQFGASYWATLVEQQLAKAEVQQCGPVSRIVR